MKEKINNTLTSYGLDDDEIRMVHIAGQILSNSPDTAVIMLEDHQSIFIGYDDMVHVCNYYNRR